MVKHHAARSFEKPALILVVCKIHYSGYTKPAGFQLLDDISPPLRPAAWRQHRVKHHGSVVVKRNPIVRENRIRSIQIFFVLDDDHLDAGLTQSAGENIEFTACPALDFFPASVRRLSLKQERWRGIRIEAERRRPHHHDGSR